MKSDADIIIVGSGIGGAAAAKELSKTGKRILIVEKGDLFPLDKIGTELHAFNYYDKRGLWSKSKEGIFYYRAIMAGGTSIVSCGNAVRSLEKEFRKLGIDLAKELREAEKELGVSPVPDKYIGRGTRAIVKAAAKLGVKMAPMPKLIDFKKCVSCGNCVVGCCADAKWTALRYLKEAQDNGVTLITGLDVTRVLISKGRAAGISARKRTGERIKLRGKTVILSAGGIGTPVILQNSGIRAGQKLFLDLFVVVYGLTKDTGMARELTMGAVAHNKAFKGFILSPFVDNPSAFVSTVPLTVRRYLYVGTHRNRMLGIMVKIKDDCAGRVHKNGVIEKRATSGDLSKLNRGAELSRRILRKAGADPGTFMVTRIRGAHPGGTAAIGEVVNKDLETKIKGLFVCDASALPEAPGLPPIVTIIALAKRFAKRFAKRQ